MNLTQTEFDVSYSTDWRKYGDPDTLQCAADNEFLRCQLGFVVHGAYGSSQYVRSFAFEMKDCPSNDSFEVPIHVPSTGLAAEKQPKQRAWVAFQDCA
jgi:hypothetical protein